MLKAAKLNIDKSSDRSRVPKDKVWLPVYQKNGKKTGFSKCTKVNFNQQPQRSAMSVTILTSSERPHYNLCQTLLQYAYIYKCYKMLQPLLQNAQVRFTTKCCIRYYTMHTLVQNAAIVITKCVAYYKTRRYYKIPQNTHHFTAREDMNSIN